MSSETLAPYTLHQISEHVWCFTPEDHTDRPSLCAVVSEKGAVLLDDYLVEAGD